MRKVLLFLASPKGLFFLLPWLMLLLIVGTVAQRYIGLAEAQRLFFTSWILWLGPVPVPGGITTMVLLTLSLTFRLLFNSPWRADRIGTILTHCGVLMLLLGGGLTSLIGQEGYITLLEGESSAQMQDYYARELTIYENNQLLGSFAEESLVSGAKLPLPNLPFTLKIQHFFTNCATYRQEKPADKHGIARKLHIEKIPPTKEKEDNKAGLEFTLEGAGEAADGGYLAHELLASRAPEWRYQGKHYRAVLARKASLLPFTIKLLEFEKLRYPGSDKAREYRSLIEINEPAKKPWRATIAMNEPLRLQGYALYQSSFVELGSTQASVLSIVKNDVWLAPYVATFVLALGLIWHLIQRKKSA